MESQNSNETSKPELLTLAEVGEVLRLKKSAVYRLAREGKVPGAVQVGRTWRVHREVFMAAMRGAR